MLYFHTFGIKNLSLKSPCKLTAVLLVFLFILTPVSPVLAQDVAEVTPIQSKKETDFQSKEIKANEHIKVDGETTKDIESIKNEESPENLDENLPTEIISEEDPIKQQTLDKKTLPTINNSNGSLSYQYPISVPPGRNNLQPDIGLQYNSQSSEEGSVLTYGWNLNIPYIERINRKGSEKLYSDDFFYSSLSGELNLISGSNWGAKVETGDFLTYSLSSNVWIVKDKTGVVYTFGTNASERQDNPSDSTKVFKWMLQEVRDTNNNYIKFEYSKDGGQIYPYKIKYTGNNTTDGIFEVEFLKESRSDVVKSYKTGFLVTTSYRIHEIQAKISSTWVRKYTLSYVAGDNTRRVVLDSITETGKDESSNTISLPATVFDYSTTMSGTSWSSETDWNNYPVRFEESIIVDVNGDGLSDIMHSYEPYQQSEIKNTYINDGDGTWTIDSNYEPPVLFFQDSPSTGIRDLGVRVADVNGDGLTDIIATNSYSNEAWLNNGNGWTTSSTWESPLPFAHGQGNFGGAYLAQLADVNGDGLPDIIRAYSTGSSEISHVYINNGAGWTENTNWIIPVLLQAGIVPADINNDGLVDLLQAYCSGYQCTPVRTAYINNGSGWTEDSNWAPPSDILFTGNASSHDEGTRLLDYNADGLPDIVKKFEGTSVPDPVNYTNTGYGWTSGDDIWNSPLPFAYTANGLDTGVRIADIDGDGMADLIRSYVNGGPLLKSSYLNSQKKADVASRVQYSKGGYTDVTYKATAQYKNGSTLLNPDLPFISNTVETITNNNGLGISDSVTYSYEAGVFNFIDSFDRRFSGFNKITKTDQANGVQKTYYHQGNATDSSNGEYSDHVSKIGQVYRTEVLNSSGNILFQSIHKWDHYSLGNDRNFVKQIQKMDMSYEGDSSHKDKAETYTYDNTYGNLTQTVAMGEVIGSNNGTYTDTGSDTFTTDISYAVNTTSYIVGLPSQSTTINQSSTKVKETKYYYDTESLGSVTKGNLTKQEDWKSSSDYVNFQRTYDSTYGLMTVHTDGRGKATNYSYDTHNLYPTTVTNALSQATSYTYDYSSGAVKTTTDPNSRVFETIYDGLDRPKEEKQPDFSTPSTLVTKTAYTYTDSITTPTFDAQTTGNSGNVTNYTLSHTTSGSNRFLVVGITSVDDRVATVSYGSVPMTKLDSAEYGHGFSVWTLVNPTSGSNNVVIHTDGNSRYMTVVVNSFTGVDQNNPIGIHSETETGSGTSESHSTASYLNDLIYSIISFGSVGNGVPTVTLGSGQTERSNVTGNSSSTINKTISSTKIAGPDATSISYTWTPSNYKLHYSFSIKPVIHINTLKTDYLDASTTVDTYNYYDGLGRVIQTRNERDSTTYSVTDFIYNNIGQLHKESLPYFSAGSAKTSPTTITNLLSTYTYDALLRILSITNAVGTTSNVYGDWKTTITDPRSKTKDIYRNAYDKLVKVDEHIDSTTLSTTYEYNVLGNLTKLTDALGNIRNFTYNGLGNVLTAQDLHASADTTFGTWNYSYDNAGNLTSRTDPNSQTVNFTYDDINRVLTEDYTGETGTEVTYEYDTCTEGIGRLCETTNATVTTEYDYNALGQLTNELRDIDTEEFTTSYTYDRQGNQLIITNPDDSQIKYLYDAGGLPYSIQHKEDIDTSFSDIISSITYNPVGLMETVNYGNGSTTTSTYDADELYRLREKVTSADNETIQDLTYTYDPVGNITQIVDESETDTAKITDYTYDDLHRLSVAEISEAENDQLEGPNQEQATQDFEYDAIGNITNNPDRGGYDYDGNQGTNYANPHAVTTTSDGRVYAYDHNGNLVNDDLLAYTWDYNNRLIEIQGEPGTFYYSYDVSGQRIKAETPNDTLYYPTKFYTATGDGAEKHIFLNDTAIASVKGSNSNADVYTIHSDHLTGSNVLTDESEDVSQLTDYYAFGTLRLDDQIGDYNEKRKYTGHEYDQDTGLTYMNARYYDATLGRFIGQDPVFLNISSLEGVQNMTNMSYDNYLGNPQMMNAYSYVANNPLKYKDQTGEFLDIVADIGFIAYDSYKLVQAYNNGGNVKAEWQALGLDVAGATLPGVTGLGMTSRAIKGIDNAAEAAKVIQSTNKISEGALYVDNIDELIPPSSQKHILDGQANPNGKWEGGHKAGTNKAKSEFPSSWSDSQIFHNTLDIATDPKSVWTQSRGNHITTGVRDGVSMRVVLNNNKSSVISAYPKLANPFKTP